MSSSKHQALVAYVAALFTAATALAGGNVYEGRDFPLPAGTASQIHVFAEDSTPEANVLTGAPVDWTTQVNVVIKARRAPGATAEHVCDSIWVDVYARAMADPTLGGGLNVELLTAGPLTRDRDEADTDVAAFTWQVSVVHRTANNTVT
jgi:hypothetical protein